MSFTIEKIDPLTQARKGIFQTYRSAVQTPCFMPVGTRASVKSLRPEDVLKLGSTIILANTYHLYLRPGPQIIEKAGGLHRFMGWEQSILTDSGGFQLFSLAKLTKLNDDGVMFSSHIDGKKFFLGPIESMGMQKSLQSDVAMCFDHCPKLPATEQELLLSLEKTHRWAKICLDFDRAKHQKLFAIVQGGCSEALRKYSCETLTSYPFDGFAIGGLSVGESAQEMYETLSVTTPHLPTDKPRYLMGVGTPRNIIEAVKHGVDLFDCVMPTRNARNATLFTWQGKMNIQNSCYKEDFRPLSHDIPNSPVHHFSRAYLRHLFNVGELSAYTIATLHNLAFYLHFMEEIRRSIENNCFSQLYQKVCISYPC